MNDPLAKEKINDLFWTVNYGKILKIVPLSSTKDHFEVPDP
jgi:hypothetical protein